MSGPTDSEAMYPSPAYRRREGLGLADHRRSDRNGQTGQCSGGQQLPLLQPFHRQRRAPAGNPQRRIGGRPGGTPSTRLSPLEPSRYARQRPAIPGLEPFQQPGTTPPHPAKQCTKELCPLPSPSTQPRTLYLRHRLYILNSRPERIPSGGSCILAWLRLPHRIGTHQEM